jgi:hypothetical protein
VRRKEWKPLLPARVDHLDYAAPENKVYVDAMLELYPDLTFEQAAARMEAYDAQCTYWRNDIYQVQVRLFHNEAFDADMMHLNIRRIDGAAVFDWRHRQWIKNQLVGDECEAFELYPAESRLVDTSNKYHLWAFVDPQFRLPVSVQQKPGRDVIDEEVRSPAGMRQRKA